MNLAKISVRVGNIEDSPTDAVVSAANPNYLVGGGGTSGAIEKAAGALYTRELTGKSCPTGEARISPGHQLLARYVIHTTVPVYDSDKEHVSTHGFGHAVRETISLVNQAMIDTLSIPILGAGHFGWDTHKAAFILIGMFATAPPIIYPKHVQIVAWTLDDAAIVHQILADTNLHHALEELMLA